MLVKFTEELEPIKNSTPEEVQEFLNNHAIPIANYMGDTNNHPFLIPFLHARQVGLEYNVIVSLENKVRPGIIINPEIIIKDKKSIQEGVELCESFTTGEHVKQPFITERATKILLTYDEYLGEGKGFKRDSKEYVGEYAVLLQQMVDFSKGKLINRFPVWEETEDK